METSIYQKIKLHLQTGEFPKQLTSSRSNFKKRAKKYELNLYGYLMREGKIVLKKSELNSVWLAMHRTHSGVFIFFLFYKRIYTLNFSAVYLTKKIFFSVYRHKTISATYMGTKLVFALKLREMQLGRKSTRGSTFTGGNGGCEKKSATV